MKWGYVLGVMGITLVLITTAFFEGQHRGYNQGYNLGSDQGYILGYDEGIKAYHQAIADAEARVEEYKEIANETQQEWEAYKTEHRKVSDLYEEIEYWEDEGYVVDWGSCNPGRDEDYGLDVIQCTYFYDGELE